MPDPDRKTLSASRVAGLFDKSPYVTRWMLWHHHAKGMDIDSAEHSRMTWGKRLQPLLLDAAAEDLALEIHPNADDTYIRRATGLLGCTRDAEIIAPDKGPGALETKCCFDYRVWMDRWAGGKRPPDDILIQTHVQMMVGDGKVPFTWGIVAVWIAGDMKYFELEAKPELWDAIDAAAEAFFADVKAGNEPEPFGVPIEMPLIAKLYPVVERKTLELDDVEVGEAARMYHWADAQAKFHKKIADKAKATVVGAAKDYDTMELPGALVSISKSETAAQIAKEAGQVIRKASVRTSVKVKPREDTRPLVDDSTLMAG